VGEEEGVAVAAVRIFLLVKASEAMIRGYGQESDGEGGK
jgi:hypothetical protein